MGRVQEEIKKDIIEQLYWDSRVDAAGLNVEVINGRVVLSGTVPTYTARVAAEADAMSIPGVKLIENNIAVTYRPGYTLPTDEQIEDDIENVFAMDPDLNSKNVRVSVASGWVTLEGSVNRHWEKAKAEEVAGNVLGVLSVTNKVAIIPTENVDDDSIAQAIIAALTRSADVDIDAIDVQVENGIVLLSGTVPNWSSRRAAREAASYTPGVIEIRDELMVQPYPL